MLIDQSEIDALLAAAGSLAAEAGEEIARQSAAPSPAPRPVAPRPVKDPQLARIYRLRVPVIVQLARRTMPIGSVCDLSVGAIIEFEKSVEQPLDLLVNNHPIGRGTCVKVGENFGLRIAAIADRRQRILSLAGE